MSNETKSIFDTDEFKQYKDRWDTRIKELNRRASYYDGSVYSKTLEPFYRLFPQLVGQIKPLYMLLSRAVDVDTGIIPGGWAVVGEDENPDNDWAQARDLAFAWSKWSTEGVLYVHYGAQYGLTGLRISDNPGHPEGARVIIQPVDPTTFMLISPSQYDERVAMAIYVEQRSDEVGEPFEYAEVITPETVTTYKNGEPFGFDEREPEAPNPYGFVPFVEIKHKKTGKPFGECTYQMAIPPLDEVNKMATELAGVIGDNRDPQVVIIGAEAGDLERGKDTVWYIPLGGDVKMIVPSIDVVGTLEFIKDVKAEVKDSLPELAFDELKSKTQIATATLELQLMELVLKIHRVRPNYDDGLRQALVMAAQIAGVIGAEDIAALLDPDFGFDPERAVLPMDPEAQLRLEMLQIERDQLEAVTRAPVEEV